MTRPRPGRRLPTCLQQETCHETDARDDEPGGRPCRRHGVGLADRPGGKDAEYLVYLPEGGKVTVDLSAAEGDLAAEWIHPKTGKAQPAGAVRGGAKRDLAAPVAGDAVLYLAPKGRAKR